MTMLIAPMFAIVFDNETAVSVEVPSAIMTSGSEEESGKSMPVAITPAMALHAYAVLISEWRSSRRINAR